MSKFRYGSEQKENKNDLAWADEQLAEAISALQAGRTQTAEEWLRSAREIVYATAKKQQSHWWNRWAASRASPVHLNILRGRIGMQIE